MEISDKNLFVWMEICQRKTFLFGINRMHFLFWLRGVHFFLEKKKRTTSTTQQLPFLPEELKHIAHMDILGASGTSETMELWHEG